MVKKYSADKIPTSIGLILSLNLIINIKSGIKNRFKDNSMVLENWIYRFYKNTWLDLCTSLSNQII